MGLGEGSGRGNNCITLQSRLGALKGLDYAIGSFPPGVGQRCIAVALRSSGPMSPCRFFCSDAVKLRWAAATRHVRIACSFCSPSGAVTACSVLSLGALWQGAHISHPAPRGAPCEQKTKTLFNERRNISHVFPICVGSNVLDHLAEGLQR